MYLGRYDMNTEPIGGHSISRHDGKSLCWSAKAGYHWSVYPDRRVLFPHKHDVEYFIIAKDHGQPWPKMHYGIGPRRPERGYYVVIHSNGKQFWSQNYQTYTHERRKATMYMSQTKANEAADILRRQTGYDTIVEPA